MSIDSVGVSPAIIRDAMVKASLNVLETMFFTSIESCAEALPPWSWQPVCVGLDFTGPLEGRCQLCLDSSAAASLAATLLCLEPEEVMPDHNLQVAAELANMICGCLLSHIEPNADLTLGSPVALLPYNPLEGVAHQLCFHLPEGVLQIDFRIDRIEGEPAYG